MAATSTIWPEGSVPSGVREWISGFFATADSKTDEAAELFAGFFQDDATMLGMTGPLHGKQAIHESRLRAWDTVRNRRHTVSRVYTIKKDFSDVLLLGKLECTMKNGNSFEMEFAAQVVFGSILNGNPKASLYKVWADPSPAIKAAKGS